MSSENPIGADNQQERSDFEQWIVGFVDGEGCFSISVVRNRALRLGWQVQLEFSVSQTSSHIGVLERIRSTFDCGSVIVNQRHDDHREPMARFSVKRRRDLIDVVVPFFEEHPLNIKLADFEKFRTCLLMMERGEHLDAAGLRRIARITEQMNRRQRSRYLKSSEAIRQPSQNRL